jgi:hypothetical protein
MAHLLESWAEKPDDTENVGSEKEKSTSVLQSKDRRGERFGHVDVSLRF